MVRLGWPVVVRVASGFLIRLGWPVVVSLFCSLWFLERQHLGYLLVSSGGGASKKYPPFQFCSC